MRIAERLSGRYGPALVLLLLTLTYTMAVPEGKWDGVGTLVLQSTALFATVAAAQADRRIMAGLTVILVLAPLLAIAQAAFGDGDGLHRHDRPSQPAVCAASCCGSLARIGPA